MYLGGPEDGFAQYMPAGPSLILRDSDMAISLKDFRHAEAERYAYLATAAFIVFEFLLQFGNEVELFWKKRWTFGKCLFLWSRYYSLGYNINNAITFMRPHPSLDTGVSLRAVARSFAVTDIVGFFPSAFSCLRFFHWQNAGAALQVITTHVVLELRIYAMYGSTRVMLCFCLALTAIEATFFGVLFGLNRPGLVATNNPSTGVFICADGDPAGGHWIMYYYVVCLILDSILLSLSLYKGWQSQRSGIGGHLMKMLTRDSVLYFVVIFFVYAGNFTMWYLNILTLDEVGTGFAFTISAVLANRLLITVRERYYSYRKEFEEMETFTSMHFQSAPQRRGDDIALDTFAEPTVTVVNAPERTGDYEFGAEEYSETRGF